MFEVSIAMKSAPGKSSTPQNHQYVGLLVLDANDESDVIHITFDPIGDVPTGPRT